MRIGDTGWKKMRDNESGLKIAFKYLYPEDPSQLDKLAASVNEGKGRL